MPDLLDFPTIPLLPPVQRYWSSQGDPLYAIYSRGGSNPDEDELTAAETVAHRLLEDSEGAADDEAADTILAYCIWIHDHCGYVASEATLNYRRMIDIEDYAFTYGWDGGE